MARGNSFGNYTKRHFLLNIYIYIYTVLMAEISVLLKYE